MSKINGGIWVKDSERLPEDANAETSIIPPAEVVKLRNELEGLIKEFDNYINNLK